MYRNSTRNAAAFPSRRDDKTSQSASAVSTSNLRTRFGRRRRLGAACVEMAFVAPFVFALVFVSVEFARVMMVKQSLTDAARAGCREAVLLTTQHHQDGEAVARDHLAGTVVHNDNPQVVRVTTTPAFTTQPAMGTEINISIEVDCSDISWLPPAFFAGASVTASSTMIRE